MARFYDAVSDSSLRRVEELLKNGGIEYSMRVLEGDSALTRIREIQVAEEDMAAAEQLICGNS